jgi:hypothetical protein
MKRSRLMNHPRQENKSGKAIYASTTSTNSSTIQPMTGTNPKPVEAGSKINRSNPRGRAQTLLKTSK